MDEHWFVNPKADSQTCDSRAFPKVHLTPPNSSNELRRLPGSDRGGLRRCGRIPERLQFASIWRRSRCYPFIERRELRSAVPAAGQPRAASETDL